MSAAQSPPAPLVSVIVPCLAHAEELGRCLASLERQDLAHPYEVIVVDSAADPEVARVAGEHPDARLLRSDARLGPGAARNLGVRHARGELLAFVDADCVAEPGWLRAAHAALERGARAVGGPVLDAFPLHPIAVTDNLLQFADFPAARPDGAADYFPGANLALRRDDFLAVGAFHETGLGSGEDGLLSAALLARWPGGLRFEPSMRVRHEGRRGLVEFLRHQRRFGYVRGVHALRVDERRIQLATIAPLLPALVATRLSYITRSVLRWRPLGLPRLALLLPLVLAGLTAWALGFRDGCRARLGRAG